MFPLQRVIHLRGIVCLNGNELDISKQVSKQNISVNKQITFDFDQTSNERLLKLYVMRSMNRRNENLGQTVSNRPVANEWRLGV